MDNKQHKALLVFGIGPVQGFIAAARRTQDLWMGSYILAYLVHVAMKEIEKHGRLVYPTVVDHPLFKDPNVTPKDPIQYVREIGVATLPNKFTAEFDSVAVAQDAAQAADKAVQAAWNQIAADVWLKFKILLPSLNGDWKTTWGRQVNPENWIEVYWAVVDNTGGTLSYQEHSNQAEGAFAMRKNLRNFLEVEEPGEKDSISGIRAALGKAENQKRKDLKDDWTAISGELRERAVIKKDPNYRGLGAALTGKGQERLSANGVIKRFSQRFFFEDHIRTVYGTAFRGRFPSTSSVASAVFRQAILEQESLVDNVNKFVEALNQSDIPETMAANSIWALKDKTSDLLRYDGAFFYPSTFTEQRLKKDYHVEKNWVEVQSALGDLRSKAKKADIDLPSSYYSLILFDGDKMGDKFKEATSADVHQEISKKLQELARGKFLEIVEDIGLGRVVYAGGDDLMAFVPIERVVEVVRQIQDAFSAGMAGVMPNETFTLSGGVVIAHHMAPLDLVLQAARTAESAAKNRYDRSAVVFSLLKRSGEQIDVGTKWGYGKEDQFYAALPIIEELIKQFKGPLSASFGHHFMREAPSLSGLITADNEAVANRLAYLLKRQGVKSGNEALAGRLATLVSDLHGLLNRKASADFEETSNRMGTLELARWIMLARFIAAAPADE